MSMAELSGRVVLAKSDRGVAGVRVEAWDSAEVTTDLIAIAVTDSTGAFTMSLDQEYLDRHFHGQQPVLSLHAFNSEGEEFVTRYSCWKVSRAPASVRIEVDLYETSTRRAPAVSIVRGTVRNLSGEPVSGVRVKAYDVNLTSSDQIGFDITDGSGQYKIQYTSLLRAGKQHPDLQVTVSNQLGEGFELAIGDSELLYHAPATAIVDVTVDPSGSNPGVTGVSVAELSRLQRQIEVHASGASLRQLQSDDIDFLARATRSEPAHVEALVAAESLLDDIGGGEMPDVFYALVRKGLPTTTRKLLAYPRAALSRELANALDEGLIKDWGSAPENRVDPILTAAVSRAFDPPPEGATGNLGHLLGKALPTDSVSREFLSEYLSHDGTVEAFWTHLATRPSFQGAGVIPAVQFALQLGALTRHHFPLIDELWERKQGGQITALKDLAAYSEADWVAILSLQRNGSPINYPADTPGSTVAEKRATFAKVLQRTMEVAFPTKATASGATRAGMSALTLFFDNNPSFELGKTRVGDYLTANPGALSGIADPAATRRDLTTIERLHKLTPRFDEVRLLYDAGLTSSREITRSGRKYFVDEFADPYGGPEIAGQIFDDAAAIAERAMALRLKFSPIFNPRSAYVVPDLSTRASEPAPALATYASLFGSPDAHDCAHCASVYGPAAYLVDLLHFLDRYASTVTKSGGAKWTAKELLLGSAPGTTPALAGRRPDIGRIDLTCENADTPLPYVDLVNEILVHAVVSEKNRAVNQAAPAFPAHIATTGTADELAAMPRPPAGEEAWHETAYEELRNSNYPFVAPYDFRAHEVRVYLEHLGVPLHVLRASISTSSVFPDDSDFITLAADRLGLSDRELHLLLGTLGVTTASAWGLAADASLPGTLLKVPELLARSGLSYDELLDLLDTSVLGRFGTPAIHPAGSSAVEEQSITGLTNPAGALEMLHRFLRLRLRLGWSIRELDQVLAACAPSGTDLVNERALRVIAVIETLRAERGLPIAVLASWFGPLDIRRRDAGKTPSFYEQLFQNKAVTNPVYGALALPGVATLSTQTLLLYHSGPIAPALRMGPEEMALLTSDSGLDLPVLVPASSDIPALESLAKLHRFVTFARAARLPMLDFLVLYNLSADTPFDVDNPERTLRFLKTVERVRRSGLSPADLEVVFRGRSSPRAQLALTDDAINAVLNQLFGSLLAARGKNVAPNDAAEAAIIENTLGASLKLGARTTQILITSVLTTGGSSNDPLGKAFSLPPELPASPAPSLDDLGLRGAQLAAYRHLARAAALVTRLGLSADELERMFVPAPPPALDLDGLPREVIMGTGSPLFAAWERLVDFVELRPHLLGPSPSLASLFVTDPGAIAAATGWPEADISSLVGLLDLALSADDRAHQIKMLLVVRHAIAVARRLDVAGARPLAWFNDISADSIAASSDVLRVVKAKYSDADWARVAPPLRDVLREKLRSVMVAYLVAKRGYEDSDELFAKLLVDVETSPAVITSRLKQAIGSVQTFVQRALLNLEASELTLPEEAAREWTWRSSYRVWEANRKVLLQPELYLDPSLRVDKTPFFKDLEAALRQGDITSEAAERAFERYLDALDEVANLEIVAAFHQKEDGDETHLPIDVFHVVGRTGLKPHKYFYRTRVDGSYWTPWEPIALDIEADNLLLVVENRRPQLFWPIIEERAEPYQSVPKDTRQAGEEAKTRRYIRLAWSERRGGKWGARRTSGGAEVSMMPEMDVRFLILLRSPADDPQPEGIAVMWAPANSGFHLGHFARNGCGDLEGKDYDVRIEDFRQSIPIKLWVPENGLCERQLVISINQATKLAVPITLSGLPLTLDLFRHVRPFRVLFPRVFDASGDPVRAGAEWFFYKDAGATLFAELELKAHTEWHKASHARPGHWTFHDVPEDDRVLSRSNLADTVFPWVKEAREEVLIAHTYEDSKRYRFTTFYHPHACLFRKELQRSGVDGLLQWSLHRADPLQMRSRGDDFAERYDPDSTNVLKPFPVEDVDFSFGGPYSTYNWELFFHAPFLIALRLMQSGRHAEARRWFHYIFDPTTGDPAPAPARFWNVRPFRENQDLASIEDELRDRAAPQQSPLARLIDAIVRNLADEPARIDLDAQIEAWRKDPFNPHLIARMRPVAYQKAVVLKYIENLIAWGDQLFRRETIEAINEATQLYILAGEILGRRPQRIRRQEGPAPRNYWQLEALGLGDFSDPLVEALSGVAAESLAGTPKGKPIRHGIFEPAPDLGELYFCVPADETLTALWDTVADRLFKIRHSMTIEGVARTLPLFEPPIDPMLLVQARALGVDLATVLNDVSSPQLPYRFQVVHAKAMELCGAVAGLGAALLAAIEKKDGEALSRLRSGHEVELLEAVREIKAQQVKEAQASVDALARSHEAARLRRDHYASLPRISAAEQEALALSAAGMEIDLVAQGIAAMVAGVESVPPTTFGGAGSFGSPLTTATVGGQASGAPIEAASRALSIVAGVLREGASIASTLAGYERRAEEWALQERLAAKEMQGLEKQLAAAKIRAAVAEMELRNHERQTEQAREVLDFLRGKKRSTEELYDWMVAELATIHYQTYTLAFDLAKRAERALRFELGTPGSTPAIVRFGAWDSLKQGLLAGERLQHDLRRLEVAFLEQTQREAELVKHVSLAEVAPEQLMKLWETGECELELLEKELDLDHPGHYFRRIKSVAITIPTVTGPYAGVNCTLRLSNTSVRTNRPVTAESYTNAENFRADLTPLTNVITTSGGVNDAGLFEPNLRDERYLPFEGAGVLGKYGIELPAANNRFDISAISDVILHIRYTARFDGDIADAAKDHYKLPANAPTRRRLFSLRSELPFEWARFMAAPSDPLVPQELSIPLTPEMFPYVPATRKIELTSVTFFARWNGEVPYLARENQDPPPEPLTVQVTRPDATSPSAPCQLTAYPDSISDRNTGSGAGLSPSETAQELGTWTLRASSDVVHQIAGALRTQQAEGRSRLNDTLQDIYMLCEYRVGPRAQS